MKSRDYCCCAIPTVNAGIYATLIEQFTLGILVGALALSTPTLVGASVPSAAAPILAILAFVSAAVQLLGFIGVLREKNILFRRYSTLHILITVGAFAVAAAWIILSATRHTTADNRCQSQFFTDVGIGATSSEGPTLCNIFTWVDIGLMGGLWLILAIMQLYLYLVISDYAKQQRQDQEQYKSLYSITNFNDIPMTTNRGDPWDARPSMDEATPMQSGYSHVRNESEASVSTILGEKQQQPRDLEHTFSTHTPSAYNAQRIERNTSTLSNDNRLYQQYSTSYDVNSPYTGAAMLNVRGNQRQ